MTRRHLHQAVRLQVERLEARQVLDATYYQLGSWGDYWQDWSDINLIPSDDNWSNVFSVIGYRGDGLTSTTGTDPQTIRAFAGSGGPVVNVMANRTNPDTLATGGVAEFHRADPIVALKGSATARAPFLLFHLDTTGVTSASVYMELHDIEGSANNAISQVALQYRVGETGDFINLPEGYTWDATEGPNRSGLTTYLWVTLPAVTDNRAQVQVRVITADAVGPDEWIGVDNIWITSSPLPPPNENLRIAVYNIASSSVPPRAGLETVLQGLGDEVLGGSTRPLDVLALQEVASQEATTEYVVGLLNDIYGAGVYARGYLNGASTGSGTQGIVYNTRTVHLLGEAAVGTASTTGQPRQALRYHLRPLGTFGGADFYLYNSHFKASDTTGDRDRRLVEANALRANADALGDGVNVFFVGDFNMYTSSEPAYQRLLAAGASRAYDPINRPGNWHNSAAFVDIFTQAPAVNAPPGLSGGGLDDRFDFQLFTAALTDSYGLDYRSSTYHTFGVNGSLPRNAAVNDPRNTALPGLPNRALVLNRLTEVSDHLPVVAEYVIGPGVAPGRVSRQPERELAIDPGQLLDSVIPFAGTRYLVLSTQYSVLITQRTPADLDQRSILPRQTATPSPTGLPGSEKVETFRVTPLALSFEFLLSL